MQRSIEAIYLNVNTEVHPMNVREKQKRLSQEMKRPTERKPCAVKVARTVSTGGMEKRLVPRSVPTHFLDSICAIESQRALLDNNVLF